MIPHKYADCSFCGGAVKPLKTTVDSWWKEKLYIFENVPAGVCRQCGEKYFTAKVARQMERAVSKNHFKRFIEVPVASLA